MVACYGNMLTGQGMWKLIPSTLLTTGIPFKMLTGQGGVEADPINIVDVGCLLITGIPSSIPACSASYWSVSGRISSPSISPAAAQHWTKSDCIVVGILTSDLVSCVTLSRGAAAVAIVDHWSQAGLWPAHIRLDCLNTLGFAGKLTRLLTHLTHVWQGVDWPSATWLSMIVVKKYRLSSVGNLTSLPQAQDPLPLFNNLLPQILSIVSV